MIIFFMVTSVFSATKGLELTLPEDDESVDRTPEPAVVVHVEAEHLYIDCQETTIDGILPYLEPILTRNPNKPVVLYTDPDAEYRRMVAVYDVLAAAGGEHSQYSFRVRDISVPTRSDVLAYVELFGENPFQTACR
ncbi:MAG TPA: biopolymer transporter ExbD [Candidatus Polarisedimenticolaceae bacterium]|nr:biopolymer transporter ExbD [Candidatus Polarisedimenticolaceae bacterium]